MSLQALTERAIALLRQAEAHPPAAFSTSLGMEDQVVTDLIARHGIQISMFTLDTGRLPAETYDLLARTELRYKRRIEVFVPQAAAVEQYVRINGINGFYESVTQRKACCEVRKTEPLARALAGKSAWVTGLRRDQAVTRAALAETGRDEALGVTKYNPLIEWTQDDVLAYVAQHDVPVSPLHARGYPSIGCAPCTRAVAAGEDVRAGRWWWENADAKECGLHVVRGAPARQKSLQAIKIR